MEEKFDAYAFDQHLKLKHTLSVYFHKKNLVFPSAIFVDRAQKKIFFAFLNISYFLSDDEDDVGFAASAFDVVSLPFKNGKETLAKIFFHYFLHFLPKHEVCASGLNIKRKVTFSCLVSR